MHTNTIIGKIAHLIVEIVTHRGKPQMHTAGTKLTGSETPETTVKKTHREPCRESIVVVKRRGQGSDLGHCVLTMYYVVAAHAKPAPVRSCIYDFSEL